MNRQLVENILAVIKASTDKSVIVKGLLKLRTDVVKDKDGILLFREAGGVTPMVRFLSKPHEEILEVALSIMGNCCTDEISCKEALQNKIVIPLATILKCIPNPIIQCRACRLLGNLAKVDPNQLVAHHCATIAQSLCRIIEDSSDVLTRMMAFRACRFLLGNPQFLKYFLQESGFATLLRILASVMKNERVVEEKLLNDAQQPLGMGLKRNQHREKYFEEVARNLEGVRSDIFDHEVLKNTVRNSNAYVMPKERAALDLICEILKCILVISELQINVLIWESLNRANCTFAPLVYFVTDDKNKHRGTALKILSNLSKNPGAFYILSSADAILAACELLVASDMERTLNEGESRYCINIISILSTDACNRSKIRRSGALKKLITMCKESKSQSEKSAIFNVLINFQYDNMSMDLMLREGLVNVLIKELEIYLTSNGEYYKKKREEKLKTAKKRKMPEVINETKCKFPKVSEEIYLDCDSPSSSPRSYNAPPSPCSSRSMSPVGGNVYQNNDSDEEAYSPVCSDDEEEDEDDDNKRDTSSNLYNNPNANCSDYTIIMNLLDIAARSEPIEDNILLDKEDDEEISQDATLKLTQSGNLPHNTIDIIDNLIFRITCLVKKSPDLGKAETMNTLIKAINIFGINMDFAGSLTNILLESQFFGQVIKQGVCHQLFQLTKIKEMTKDGFGFLDTLTSVGECNYGKEELARLLRCEDVISQKRAAITVGYIIKSKPLLYQFLNDGNALSILLNIILSAKQDEYTAEAVDCLTCMSRFTLGIDIPQTAADRRLDEYDIFEAKDAKQPLHDTCDMRFLVHDQRNDKVDEGEGIKDNNAKAAISIGFNKELLCSTSEVFNTMLNSDFREGNEGEIHLRTYSVTGLLYFLNLIVRQSKKLKLNIPPSNQYHALLEAFEMSRIYIIPEMEQFVLQLLISKLDESNCLSVLEWSLKNYHVELTEMAINYYLCSSLSTEAKVNLYRTADYSTYSTEWFEMIIEAVLARCRNGF